MYLIGVNVALQVSFDTSLSNMSLPSGPSHCCHLPVRRRSSSKALKYSTSSEPPEQLDVLVNEAIADQLPCRNDEDLNRTTEKVSGSFTIESEDIEFTTCSQMCRRTCQWLHRRLKRIADPMVKCFRGSAEGVSKR